MNRIMWALFDNVECRKKLLIQMVVFLFPIVIATIQHVGGVLYLLLILAGISLGWSGWKDLCSWEKKTLIGFLLFFIFISLSLINSQNLSSAVKMLTRYMYFPLLIPMYFLFKKYQVEAGKALLVGLLLSSIIMFGQAYYQTVILGWGRAVGAYNPIVLGDIAIWCATIIVCAFATLSLKWNGYVIGFLSISLALLASIMAGSKGGWIFLPVLAVWLLWMKRDSVERWQLIAMVSLAVLLLFGALSVDKVSNRIDVAINNYNSYIQDPTKINSVGARLEMWRDSVTIWKSHPVIGTGLGDFKEDRLKFYNEGTSYVKQPFGHAHSIYFDVLAKTGLVGLVAMLFFMLFVPYRMFNQFFRVETDQWIKFYALSGMATIIAFSVFGLTEGWLSRNAFVRVYLMSILVFMSSIAVRKTKKEVGNCKS